MESNLFLTPAQRGIAVVGVAAAAVGAAEITAHLPPETPTLDGNTLARIVAGTLAYAASDVAATKIRHPQAQLAWNEFYGRGGHVAFVALGLAVTFALAPATFHAIHLPTSLAPYEANMRQFSALFFGVLPWVLWDAAKNPAHTGKRGAVVLEQTLRTFAGASAATVVEPIVGSVLNASLGSLGAVAAGLAAVITATVGGYLPFLLAGWLDYGTLGLSDSEKGRNNV